LKAVSNILAQSTIQDCSNPELEPTRFYAKHGHEFPIATAVYKRFMSTQVTTVRLESFFSTTGNIQSEDRTSMSTDTLKHLAILKANLFWLPTHFCRSWVKLSNMGALHDNILVAIDDDE